MVLSRTLIFLDQWVCKLIVEKYGMNEMRAIRDFLTSETYQMLVDPETELYMFSPYVLFDLWECEKVMGNPRYSAYLRANTLGYNNDEESDCHEEGN